MKAFRGKYRRVPYSLTLSFLVITSSFFLLEDDFFTKLSDPEITTHLNKLEYIEKKSPADPPELIANQQLIDDSIDETYSTHGSDIEIRDDSPSILQSSSWLELARNSPYTKISQENGTLQVNTQVGETVIQGAPIEVRNTSNFLVTSGISNSSGNYTVDILPIGNYTVTVQQTTNFTLDIEINSAATTIVTADFGWLRVTTEDDIGNPVDATIEIRNSIDGTIDAIGLSSGSSGNKTFIVAPRTYDVISFFGYGQSKPSVIVLAGDLSIAHFIFGSIQGKFGSIEVQSNGFFDMPLTTSVNIRNYTSGVSVASGTTDTITGKRSWDLAPDVYTVEITESNTIIRETIVVTANVQTNITSKWGVLIVYQDNTSNTFVELYNAAGTSRITYDWINTGTHHVVFTLEPGSYNIHYSSQNFPVTIHQGNRTLVNPQKNTAPSRLSVFASPARINANEQTNISVRVSDVNYDYKNLTFTWTPNVGSISGVDEKNRFVQEMQYQSTVTYTAPSSLQTMYIDIFVTDNMNGNFSYRIYVSNRQGTVYINSTQLGGIGKSNTFIELYNMNTGSRTTYNWADTNGWVIFPDIWEDEYQIRALEHNQQFSSIFHLDPDFNYSYNFKWGLLHVNSTGLNGELIDTQITIYNQTTNENYNTLTTTTSGNGYTTFYVAQGVYKLQAIERNSIWKPNVSVFEHQESFSEFKFSVIAVYYLDDNGNPQSKFVQVFNRTTGIRNFYDWTSTSGFVILIVAPYTNYTIQVDHNTTFSYIYEPITILPNAGQNVGQFLNHEPTITGYNANPFVVLPSENSTITITAVDPDPLDILTYVYTPSMGSVIGSGNIVTYVAPATIGFYYLNISVVDPHGGHDNITRSLSARSAPVSVNVTDFQNSPLVNNFLEIYDWTTGGRLSYGWTDGSGYVVFPSVPESFYYLRAHAANVMQSNVMILGDVPFDYTFKFGALFVNSTGGNHTLISTYIRIYPAGTVTEQSSGNTVLTGLGHIRFDLRPDTYDIRGEEVNYLFYKNTTITNDSNVHLTFEWAELNITTRSVMNMPLDSFWEIYNSTTNTRYTYDWAPISTGQNTVYTAPGTDYQVRIHADNIAYLDVIAIASEITNVEGRFGVIRASQTDIQGNPYSLTISVHNATTDTYIVGRGTGSDGVCFFYLTEGYYRVTNSTHSITNVTLAASAKVSIEFGPSINNYPSIYSVTSSPTRIGPSSSTFILIQATDIDYDYDTMDVLMVTSTGSLGQPEIGWIQKERWSYRIEYFSPSSSELYQINITLVDGRGGSRFFMLVVSDRTGTFQITSQGNAFKGLRTDITVYRESTGAIVYSGNTNDLGQLNIVLSEDFYNIRAREHNDYWVLDTWLRGGDIFDITILWGELTVYSTGVGGEPLQNTFIEVFDQNTGVRYTYAWTDAAGKVHFILAPGLYKIVLTESTSIIFENLIIIGGATLALGSEVPAVTHPSDIIYPENLTGNVISWVLTDTNPAFYNVILDGVTFLVNTTTWVNGTLVIVSIDNLPLGEHYVVLFANDTSGYEQYDIVLILVTPAINAPEIINPISTDYLSPVISIVVQNSTEVVTSWYQLYYSSWSDNYDLSWNGSYWKSEIGLTSGTYILQVYIRDSHGFERVSDSTFTILPLSLLLTFPLNNSILQSNAWIDIALSGGITLNYNWDEESNITRSIYDIIWDPEHFSPILPTTEGLHSLEVFLTDVGGTTIRREYHFTVDDTPPAIESYDDLADGSEVGAGTSIPFSIAELHFEEFSYYWNNSEGRTETVITDIPWVEAPIVTGTWTLNLYASDQAGNTREESITIEVLSSTSLTLIYPNGGEVIGGYVNISWSTPETLSVDLFYSPDAGFSWLKIGEDLSSTFYLWDTARDSLNGSSFLIRILSTTIGKPGEARSESVFTLLNIITRELPVGSSEIEMPDINITITVSSPTNVTIRRLTEVPMTMNPNASNFFSYGLFVDIVLGDQEALEVLIISFNVELLLDTFAAQGLTIKDIKVYFYNETSHNWEPADVTEYNETLNVVIGTFNHTTTIGALGRSNEKLSGNFPFFLIFLIVLVLGGTVGGALLLFDHQQHALSGTQSLLSQIQKFLAESYSSARKKFGNDG